jgi:hypothetical protein
LLGALLVVPGWEEIAGELLAQELVVRLVLVESCDDVVAITPRIRVREVDVLARASVYRARSSQVAPFFSKLVSRAGGPRLAECTGELS